MTARHLPDEASVVTREVAWRHATNPVLPAFHPDPSVCRVDHGSPGASDVWYYLISSTFEYLPGLPVHRSRDLVTWELVGHVVTDQLDYTRVHDSGGLYAPTIRHDGERFLVVCTHLGGPEGASGTFITTATDAAGPWTPPVWWHGVQGVDPSLLLDDDGRIWAHGGRGATPPQWEGHGEIWVRELDPATLELTGPEHVIWSGAAVGATWPEGPHLYRRGRHVYLVAAEGGTGRHHAVVVARAEQPTGPFTSAPDNPVLTHRHLGPEAAVVNVGHADLVQASDGSWWALALASRLAGGIDLLGRETFLLPVTWRSGICAGDPGDDGDWPVLAPGVGTLVPEPGGPDGVRADRLGGGDGVGAGLGGLPERTWIGVRRLPSTIAETGGIGGIGGVGGVGGIGGAGEVALRAGAGLGDHLPAFIGQRLHVLEGSVTQGLGDAVEHLSGPAEGGIAEVGLALRQSTPQWLTVGVRSADGGTEVVVTRSVDGTVEVAAAIAAPAGLDRLRLTITGRVGLVEALTADGAAHEVGRVDVGHLSTTHAGWFVGVVTGPYAVGDGVLSLPAPEQVPA
ncbi:glycoside hydrolase family 43 protein [Miniimonas sp. S16]|uniref:glycoside hydrolase family 43 protein n=1 Tax=Miniimonas sp. S16 TaxID=2171623 RepID=UPI001F1E7075|nr:glycoside hydrolase family 43 protein [Miniimonas sp. S16]